MQVFLGLSFTEDGHILLSPEESKHCVKVLRHKAGDIIDVIDGIGHFYTAEITKADPDKCTAKILTKKTLGGNKKYHLHIAISPTKNADRIEWLIEKGTELGVDEFSFLICKRTEKTGVKTDRFKKIAESAVKQSIQSVVPRINEKMEFTDFIKVPTTAKRYIAHCLENKRVEFKDILKEQKVLVMIGPEGDFTDDEIAWAQLAGFSPLSLGETRLRTETAGLFVAAGFKVTA